MNTQNLVLIITATLTALIAGLFYSYSCSVNPGLGKLADREYLLAMQSINKEILNPVFFLSFMGTLFMLPISTFLHYKSGDMIAFWLLLAATILYAAGTFVITMAGNVPLNETLNAFDINSNSVNEIAEQRRVFESSWNMFHSIRTIAAIAALILVITGCVLSSPNSNKDKNNLTPQRSL